MPTIISWETIYDHRYCLTVDTGSLNCIESVSISSFDVATVKEIGSSILLYWWGMVAIIFIILFVLKKIFSFKINK